MCQKQFQYWLYSNIQHQGIGYATKALVMPEWRDRLHNKHLQIHIPLA